VTGVKGSPRNNQKVIGEVDLSDGRDDKAKAAKEIEDEEAANIA